MSGLVSPSSEELEAQAAEKARDCDWTAAAELYTRALSNINIDQDDQKRPWMQERAGHAYHQAAMQARNPGELARRIRSAIEHYQSAADGYSRRGREEARGLRCSAMVSYLETWLIPTGPEKRKPLEEAWSLTEKSLNAFEEKNDPKEFVRTYNQLAIVQLQSASLLWDYQEFQKKNKDGLALGQKAIKLSSPHVDPVELARAHMHMAAFLANLAEGTQDLDEKERMFHDVLEQIKEAKNHSEQTAQLQLSLRIWAGDLLPPGTPETVSYVKGALELARKTGDRLVTGGIMDSLAYDTLWESESAGDPEEKARVLREAIQYAEDAEAEYSAIAFTSPRGGALSTILARAEGGLTLAKLETDRAKRRSMLNQALQAARAPQQRIKESGYASLAEMYHHVNSKVLAALAAEEKDSGEKKRLLQEAMEHRTEDEKIGRAIDPYGYGNQGVMTNYLANIKAELAKLADNPEEKRALLTEAIQTKKLALDLRNKEKFLVEKYALTGIFGWLADRQYEYGQLLNQLYNLTQDELHLQQAITAWEEAAGSFKKAGVHSRVAECLWKAAQAYDALGEYDKSAQLFTNAEYNYTTAAERTRLRDFYTQQASYMQAWSGIEKARHHHNRQEYQESKDRYEQAAESYKTLREWSFLAPNFSAWAHIEEAEKQSTQEHSREAIQALEEASRLFQEGKTAIRNRTLKTDKEDEKEMMTKLVEAAEARIRFCKARILLEEGKVLAQKGDHLPSAEKFSQAAEEFQTLMKDSESQRDQKELGLIARLCHAWQAMAQAEGEASPELYQSASKLFEEAKVFSSSEKTTMLLMGHSRFCKALEAGTRFADTRESDAHNTALAHLQSAANYYLRAGFRTYSEYAKATELLFDAYFHMDNAKREPDLERKVKLFTLAEKVLQASADGFLKSEHPAKRDLVLKQLESVREERQLAASLTEVLQAPMVLATTKAFTTPTSTYEQAVGLEKFENADVQASLILQQQNMRVGEDINVEIELANVGRGPARLLKLEELVPDTFELAGQAGAYRMEGAHLNLKGKELGPLKTEELKLALRPKAKGHFSLKPRIVYMDENGNRMSHQPEPVELVVTELGISGWLKGQ